MNRELEKRRRSSILSDSHVFAVDADRTEFRFSSPEPALHANYSMEGRRVATDSSWLGRLCLLDFCKAVFS